MDNNVNWNETTSLDWHSQSSVAHRQELELSCFVSFILLLCNRQCLVPPVSPYAWERHSNDTLWMTWHTSFLTRFHKIIILHLLQKSRIIQILEIQETCMRQDTFLVSYAEMQLTHERFISQQEITFSPFFLLVLQKFIYKCRYLTRTYFIRNDLRCILHFNKMGIDDYYILTWGYLQMSISWVKNFPL